ncbi:MAG: hypothetical protein KCHDKBKB_01048 [Elusimicrobia bacterium]|nr:hypothetical protein [Elusimicrobiota bacterium]
MERDLAVINHRSRDHTPRVSVFTDSAHAPLTTAAVKRHRFIQNLKTNHQKFIEALAFVERFAVVCELSNERIAAIIKAKDEAIDELAEAYQEKLKAYDERIIGEKS